MLPGLDGLSLIERVREKNIKTPVLILSARRTVDDRVKGLQTGGDDYMTKPFSFSELLARIQALIRRATQTSDPSVLRAGDLTIDLLSREANRGGEPVTLPSKTSILEHVYDYSFDPQTNVVDVLVCRLRNKVDRDFEPKMIHTVRGTGYVLKEK